LLMGRDWRKGWVMVSGCAIFFLEFAGLYLEVRVILTLACRGFREGKKCVMRQLLDSVDVHHND